MGMAASQVRFLTLQDRKSTIGMRLGILSNRKMALTRDMNKAAREYNDAYTETKLQWYDSINGSYTDITYNAMMSPNAGNSYTPYLITDRNTGRVILDGVTNVGTLCSTGGVGTNMASFMSTLTGDSVSTPYLPGTMTYNEEAMAPRIIQELMGISNFDETKKIYKGVENVDLTDGGWEKVDHSDLVSQINKGIKGNVAARSANVVPVWEFRDDDGLDEFSFARTLSLLSGEFIDYASRRNNGNLLLSPPELMTESAKNVYLDSSGNAHTLSADTYWSTLYENGAVVVLPYSATYAADVSSCAQYSDPANVINSWGDASGYNSIETWISGFVNEVNNSKLLKYEMSQSDVNAVVNSTKRHLVDTFNSNFGWGDDDPDGYSWGADKHKTNVDSHIYTEITKVPENLNHNVDSVKGKVNWNGNKGFESNNDFEYAVFSGQEGDPIGHGSQNGTSNVAMAIAKQANAISAPIIYSAGYFRFNQDSGNLQNINWEGRDGVAAISVKNMMDVAIYYIELAQQRLANGLSVTEDGDNGIYTQGQSDNGYSDYSSGNNKNYTDPGNYNQGEIEIFRQGETKVASIYSMLSNLEMLDEKVSHYDSTYGNTYGGAWAWVYNGNNTEGYSGLKQYLTEILNNGYDSNKSKAEAQLIALANINAWMCEALSQDCSTQEGYNQMVEYCSNIWKDLSILWDTGFQESTWDETQTGATWSQANSGHQNTQGNPQYFEGQFYYDDGVDWNRREHLFSQDSEKKVATSRLDIEGQLTVLQLKQFKFYVNLVKECLARGWKSPSSGNNSNVDNNSTTLHLQNGTWLINDTTAKSSSRIFEVNNKEAREEALSKYEALQSELKMKEERIDIQMDKLETEQNAINNELDSLQNIISDNIKSTFKIFS